MQTVELDSAAAGDTVHWGQLNTIGAVQVQDMFPRLEKWRLALAQFTDNGRETTFSTDFTRRRGLEVIRPVITSLRSSESFTAAGEGVIVSWDASHNPPWTSTRLELAPTSGGVITIPAEPSGAQSVVVGDGVNVIRLVAQTALSGLSRTEDRAVTVTGFGPLNRYYTPSVPAPVCQVVDGEDHWVAEFELPTDDWSARLFAGNIRLAAWAPDRILVRKVGGSEFLLTFRTFSVGFVVDTPMAGQWQLIAPSAGCAAPAPSLGIDITVVTH
jgi:hypothetical protein